MHFNRSVVSASRVQNHFISPYRGSLEGPPKVHSDQPPPSTPTPGYCPLLAPSSSFSLYFPPLVFSLALVARPVLPLTRWPKFFLPPLHLADLTFSFLRFLLISCLFLRNVLFFINGKKATPLLATLCYLQCFVLFLINFLTPESGIALLHFPPLPSLT